MSCLLCGHLKLIKILSKNTFKEISSSCNQLNTSSEIFICKKCSLIQKKITSSFESKIHKIYSNYKIYHLGNRKDNKSFSNKKIFNRSEFIIKKIKEKIQLPKFGNMLDYGSSTGFGAFTFKKKFSRWKTYAYEKYQKNRNSNSIFLSETSIRKKSFDLIYLSHVFEHFLKPRQEIYNISNMLKNDGILVIQVPYFKENFFDIFVADHCMHLEKKEIKKFFLSKNFKIIHLNNDIIKHELTIILKKNKKKKQKKIFKFDISKKKEIIKNKLIKLKIKLENIPKDKKIIIFGTGISSSWLAQEIKNKNDYYIDEDANKIGKRLKNKEIILPKKNWYEKNKYIMIVALPNPLKKKVIDSYKKKIKIYSI